MSQESAIEWTDATWNPTTGCDRVSPGCAHCYALDLAARLKGMGQARYQKDGDPKTSGPGFGLTLHPDKLNDPLRWKKPRMVFVNSMSDLFHEEVPDDFIHRVFQVMERAERHTFQVLTKRPERMAQLVPWLYKCEWCEGAGCGMCDDTGSKSPLPNVWLGTSIENRRFVHRADLLRQTPAAVRFISAEPLLGALICESLSFEATAPTPEALAASRRYEWADGYTGPHLHLSDIDWLIVGGESGPQHRPVNPEWVRDLRDAAVATVGTAFFFKQWGGRTPKAGGRELDGRTWDEMPARQAVAA